MRPVARSSQSVARNAVWSLIGFVVPVVTMLVTIPVYLEWLGPRAYGVWATGVTVIGAMGVLNLGLGTATTKYVAEYTQRREPKQAAAAAASAFVLFVPLGSIAAVVAFLVAKPIASGLLGLEGAELSRGKGGLEILAWGLIPALSLPGIVGVFNGLQKYQWSQSMHMLRSVASAAAGVVALLTLTPDARLVGLMTTQVAVLAMVWGVSLVTATMMLGPRNFSLRVSMAMFPKVISFGFHTWLASIGALLVATVDRLLIGFLGPEWVTYYSIPQQVAWKVTTLSGQASQSLMPYFSARHAASEAASTRGEAALVRAFGTAWLGSVLFVLAIGTPLVSCVSWLLEVWTDAETAKRTTSLLRLFAAVTTFAAMFAVPYFYLFGRGRPATVARWAFAGGLAVFAVQIPLVLWTKATGDQMVGAHAVAFAVVVYPLALLGMSLRLLRDSEMHSLRRSLWAHSYLPLLSAICGGLAGVGLGGAVHTATDSPSAALGSGLVATWTIAAGMFILSSRLQRNNAYVVAAGEIADVLRALVQSWIRRAREPR